MIDSDTDCSDNEQMRATTMDYYRISTIDDVDMEIDGTKQYCVQIIGKSETGISGAINVVNYKPHFYVQVNSLHHKVPNKTLAIDELRECLESNKIRDVELKIEYGKRMRGFDNGKEYLFINIIFNTLAMFKKAKYVWYERDKNNNMRLIEGGININMKPKYIFELHEAHIPPILHFIHELNICTSGWVEIPQIELREKSEYITLCNYEYLTEYNMDDPLKSKLQPRPDMEQAAKLKICSMDIEASSSHGDFPQAIKGYDKLSNEMIDYFKIHHFDDDKKTFTMTKPEITIQLVTNILLTAFNFANFQQSDLISQVYPKKQPELSDIEECIDKWISTPLNKQSQLEIEEDMENNGYVEEPVDNNNNNNNDEIDSDDEIDEEFNEEMNAYKDNQWYLKMMRTNSKRKDNIISMLNNKSISTELKRVELCKSLNHSFPNLMGDTVTCIGSTFWELGKSTYYLNNCIVVGDCDPVADCEIMECKTEKEVLIAWKDLILREDPDIIIGYNIFGFDYDFMFKRSKELNCVREFLKMSRFKNQLCANERTDYKTNQTTIKLDELSTFMQDLQIIPIKGRIQIDFLSFFKREEPNLSSYKLDDVSGIFIGDKVKTMSLIENNNNNDNTEKMYNYKIKSGNLVGLTEDCYIHFELLGGHSTNYLLNGLKFNVTSIIKETSTFMIKSTVDLSKYLNCSLRWCLAKDNISPKEIFALFDKDKKGRSIVAKYCVQDCNLVHQLMYKKDVFTGLVEMAKISYVPISYLISRGQSIKATSFIGKKCKEQRIFVPTLDKSTDTGKFEGAIVLDPKTNIYIDDGAVCNDFASLYPSTIISENISHDSKVMTKSVDICGNTIGCEGYVVYDKRVIYINESYVLKQWILPKLESLYKNYKYFDRTHLFCVEMFRNWNLSMCYYQLSAIQERINYLIENPDILAILNKNPKINTFLINTKSKNEYKKLGEQKRQLYINNNKSYFAELTANELDKLLGLNYKFKYLLYQYGINTGITTGIEYHGYWHKITTFLDIDNENYDTFMDEFESILDLFEEMRGRMDSFVYKYDGMEKYKYIDLSFDLLEDMKIDDKKKEVKQSIGVKTCKFVQYPDNTNALIPTVLKDLLAARKATKVLMKKETDPFMKNVYDKRQLGYKLTANSLYGQCGAKISTIYEKDIAASTTAGGRLLLTYAKKIIEECYVNQECVLKDGTKVIVTGEYIYGDTDSVFFKINPIDAVTKKPIKGKENLRISIEVGQQIGELATQFLKPPHDWEYEKTFLPFILFAKKRYLGILFEFDVNCGKPKDMGTLLKRRDNAPIAKDIYGAVTTNLIDRKDSESLKTLDKMLTSLMDGEYEMSKLTITKALRSYYKNPNSIAHKVLATRMRTRDPGSAPGNGDRVPYVYIVNPEANLQGERIESPEYIAENKLQIDYSFYVSNQIMKPIVQLFALMFEKVYVLKNEMERYDVYMNKCKKYTEYLKSINISEDKITTKMESLKLKELSDLLFGKFIKTTYNFPKIPGEVVTKKPTVPKVPKVAKKPTVPKEPTKTQNKDEKNTNKKPTKNKKSTKVDVENDKNTIWNFLK